MSRDWVKNIRADLGIVLAYMLSVLASKCGNSHFLRKQVGAAGRNQVLTQEFPHEQFFLGIEN